MSWAQHNPTYTWPRSQSFLLAICRSAATHCVFICVSPCINLQPRQLFFIEREFRVVVCCDAEAYRVSRRELGQMRRPLTSGPTRQPQRASSNQQQRAGPVASRILAMPIQIAAAATQRRRGTQPSEAAQIPNLRPLLHPKVRFFRDLCAQ